MKYITDRKRAEGLGSSRSGTHHHWQEIVTSIAMVVIVPVVIFTFGFGIGGDLAAFTAFFGHPLVTIIMAISLIVGVYHLLGEAVVAIEDYVHGIARQLTIVAVTAFCYTLIGVGLFALLKLAL